MAREKNTKAKTSGTEIGVQKRPKQLAQQEQANGATKPANGLTAQMRRSAESTFRWTGGLLGIERTKIDALLA